jgi:hypothetical protein
VLHAYVEGRPYAGYVALLTVRRDVVLAWAARRDEADKRDRKRSGLRAAQLEAQARRASATLLAARSPSPDGNGKGSGAAAAAAAGTGRRSPERRNGGGVGAGADPGRDGELGLGGVLYAEESRQVARACLQEPLRKAVLDDVVAQLVAAGVPHRFHPRAVHLLAEPFTVANGQLLAIAPPVGHARDLATGRLLPTMHDVPLLNRPAIRAAHARQLELLFQESAAEGPLSEAVAGSAVKAAQALGRASAATGARVRAAMAAVAEKA